MHWSRVKTILIFLFLSLDIFMLAYILYANHDPYTTAKSEIDDIIGIYSANNIEIDGKIIPHKTEKLGIIEMDNLWTSRERIAARFFPEGYAVEGGRFVNGGKSLEFYEDYFMYKNSAVSAEEGARTDGFMRELGIDPQRECYSGDTVRQRIDGKSIFETAVTVEGGKNGISELRGYWIISDNENTMGKDPVKLRPISGVLIEFLATNAYNKDGDRIVSIETGYSTGTPASDTTHKLVSVLPAYRITSASGGYAVFDATEGALLYEGRN